MSLVRCFYSVAIASLGAAPPVLANDVRPGSALYPTASAVAVAERSDHIFTLTNDTSVDMLEFYASPQTASDWEVNVLGDKTVQANGDWTVITLSSDRGCLYDFLAVFADGDKLDKYGIDVCELETHTYYEN